MNTGNRHAIPSLPKRHSNHFGQVQRVSSGALPDLLAATKTISDDEQIGGRVADRWQKLQFSNGERRFIFFFLESECPSHSAASRRWHLTVNIHARKDCLLIRHLHNGFVMAMTVNQRSAADLWNRKILRLLLQEFTQKPNL